MYLRVARMAKALQVCPVKHKVFHSEFMRNGFNRGFVVYFGCKRT
ncbi:hypothetical protein M087_1646 [Bacteroides fragilis str. S23 R14]|nr:hypothetical protein M087_1646 [Bacteroides fragilis str. S23 R14]